jgi:hypothetical protein
MIKEALRSFETSALPRATRRNIPEDAILHVLRKVMAEEPMKIMIYKYHCNNSFDI